MDTGIPYAIPHPTDIYQGCPVEDMPDTPKNAPSLLEVALHPEEFFGKGEIVIPISMNSLDPHFGDPPASLSVTDSDGHHQAIKAYTATFYVQDTNTGPIEFDGPAIQAFTTDTLNLYPPTKKKELADFHVLGEEIEEPANDCEQYADVVATVVRAKDAGTGEGEQYYLNVIDIRAPRDGILSQTGQSGNPH